MRRREEEWKVERERLEKRIGELKVKREKGGKVGETVQKIEERVRMLEEGGGKAAGRKGKGELEERVRSLEREKEKRERAGRRNNVVVKGFKEIEGDARKGLEEVFQKDRSEDQDGRDKSSENGKGGERRDGDNEIEGREKKEVMEKKRELKGGRVWIEDDLTWEERRSRWKFRETVVAEERKGTRVWIGSGGKVMIEGEW